jgi:hypothetical protein
LTKEGYFLIGNRELLVSSLFPILAEITLELGTSPHEEKVVGALVAGLNPPPYALTVARSSFPVAFNCCDGAFAIVQEHDAKPPSVVAQ